MKKLIITLVISFFASQSFASFNGNSNIKLLSPLRITELSRLNFGVIEKPTERVWVGVRRNGTSEGTANILDSSPVQNGLIQITGSDTETINIRALDLNTHPELKFRRINGVYNGDVLRLRQGVSNVSAPTNIGVEMSIFSRLWVEPEITTGNYQPAFLVEVNYD